MNLIILGDGSVGKTSMIKMYAEKKFTPVHMATLGLDFAQKNLMLPGFDKEFMVKIWDTAGQERFRTLTESFYKQAQGIIIAFDVTNAESFKNVRGWMESIQRHAPENVCMVLAGNKCDMRDARQVFLPEIEEFTHQTNLKYFEVSAKENMNINEVFEELMN